ncbi:endonuclease/exonuclease/phosphatase family protein [Sphingomonas sp. R86520]|uniref:endonuclease/exonuclease/phosphatase family protein n=1 Tax=Sphingomonas sp. R86520 TaxID=3093859 RepID=UPI0036D2AADE
MVQRRALKREHSVARPAWRGSARWTATSVIGATLLWYLLFLALGDGGRLIGYVNAFGFWWAIVAMVAAGWLATDRAWLRSAVGIVLGIVILTHGGVAIGRRPAVTNDAPTIRLVTASLRTSNHDMEAAAAMILAETPDLIVAQEVDVPAFTRALGRRSRGWSIVRRGNELVACRCPISGVEGPGHVLRARAALPSGPVTVWSLHAPKSYGRTVAQRVFFNALAADIDAHRPGILAGDFNATPWNDGYRIIADVYRDTWLAAGRGPGFTFPTGARRAGSLFPYIRIDHVFASRDLIPIESRLGTSSAGADHLPLVVTFAMPSRRNRIDAGTRSSAKSTR